MRRSAIMQRVTASTCCTVVRVCHLGLMGSTQSRDLPPLAHPGDVPHVEPSYNLHALSILTTHRRPCPKTTCNNSDAGGPLVRASRKTSCGSHSACSRPADWATRVGWIFHRRSVLTARMACPRAAHHCRPRLGPGQACECKRALAGFFLLPR